MYTDCYCYYCYCYCCCKQIRVVQASLMGSILSNLLLVLGSAFFAGGLFSGKLEQKFNPVSAGANTSLLMSKLLQYVLRI
jgi:calcium/proton exchanger cax